MEVKFVSLKEIMQRGVKRRTFLTVTGITGIAAFFGLGCEPEEVKEPDEVDVLRHYDPNDLLAYDEGEWVPTGCAGCTSWCTKVANVVDGRVVKVQGNPNSKTNEEHSCPRSQLSIQQVYDPDRIKQPMRRTNPNKGRDEDPQWEPISWDEAMEEVADKVYELIEKGETEKFLVFRGRYTRLRDILYGFVPSIIGSPNNISHSSICAEAEKFGPYYSEAIWGYRDFDTENTKYAILWGVDPINSNRQVSSSLNYWGDLLDNATVVTIDPRFSVSAAKSHKWLPVKPGEDGALALAMAHVILSEGLWSREFVGDFVDGNNQFLEGQEVNEDDFEEEETLGVVKWWNMELKDRTPEWAAQRCGIDADTIREVAIGFAENGPNAFVWMGGGSNMQIRGGYNSMAVSVLNGLVGAVDNEGGTLHGMSAATGSWPDVAPYIRAEAEEKGNLEKIDQRGRLELPALKNGQSGGGVVTNNAARGIIDEDPMKIKVGFGYWNNFNFSCPGTHRWDEAMKNIDFYVHMVTHESEMTRFADIVLPSTHHMFEQWGTLYQKQRGYTHHWMSRPMIDRVFDVKEPEAEVMWLLAEKLADRGFTDLLDFFKEFKDPETGAEPTDEYEFGKYAVKIYTRPIWDPEVDVDGDSFNGWDEWLQVGVWNSERYPYRELWGGNFGTKTGKFEFYSETLKEALEGHADRHGVSVGEVLDACDYEVPDNIEKAYLPHYQEPVIPGDESEYPLVFVDYKNRLNREGRSANCYWQDEFKDVTPGLEPGVDYALINPSDAANFGISTGDDIRVTSPSGELICQAKEWEGTPPGTLVKAYGEGHWAYGRVAADVDSTDDYDADNPRGGNNNDVIPAVYERLSGSTVFYAATRVNVQSV